MPDRRRTVLEHPRRRAIQHGGDGLTASVNLLDSYNTQTLVIQPNEWQTEAWGYFHSLGELNFAIDSWLSNAISRCRLFAAQRIPGSDDPQPVLDGPIADIVSGMAGGLAGQTAMLKRMAVHISVPGDSYLVTEDDPIYGNRTSKVYSNVEIRITSRNPLKYQVQTERQLWRALAPEALVSRVWWPDAEYAWRATSPCEAALPIMREIDMYNRYIVSILLSRVASNGMLLIPDEVTFPVKPQFKDQADPFMANWIDVATRAIKNPGSAAAALPMPIRVPAQYIEAFKHLTFATEMGDKVLEQRQAAIDRLAVSLNMPPEAMKGMGDTNHWGAWQISEDAVKIHIAPPVEVICAGLTESFLRPMALAAGQELQLADGSEYIIWYDASALVQQPDRSDEAQAIYALGELTGEALRRDSGFEEADKPNDAELKRQVLMKIALAGGTDSLAALSELVGDPSIALIPTRVTVTDPTTTPPDQLGDPNAPPETPPPAAPGPPPPPGDTGPAPATVPPARQ